MKKLVLLFAIVFMGGGLMAQTKIATVNSQSLLDSLPSYQDAMAYLVEKDKEGARELQIMKETFQKDYEKFINGQADMPPVVREHEEKKLMEADQAIQQKTQTLQTGLQELAQKMNEPILKKVQDAIKMVAETKKYDHVFDQSMLMYFNDAYDITEIVLVELLKMDAVEIPQ
jgi:outer membrane protein